MPWFKLTGDERINQRCATEGCGGQPTSRLEADGVGSNYCSGCRTKIESVCGSINQLEDKYRQGIERIARDWR